ncbi:MAG: bifunctional [glutamate--ammonia ligase]-adenylyl-L-tyrosine phosphorylase/[glutamate--ammonia-ligase] adenylyltransferase [Nitrospirae bacterium]|nr:bifunctional [glutamate--ammonia ligase]-adenylyl-L-tyrosine phosphorylase/[glutamate--ammonia-ligase] adenylyltransferase [Nitrospirota bacterium]NTW64838.1 bifunctional [glutamate--ammonia ligase]-adenylyl-L-tyrosine phosphorylase/[glutamate--ammonia-ligase] adenylyltransferase [Nitrospirota bacterium]
MTNNNEISADPAVLSAAGIQDASQALRNLELVRKRLGPDDFAELLPLLLLSLKRSGDPDMALNHLERFLNELDPVSQFVQEVRTRPAVLTDLIVLFGASRFLASHCIATASAAFPLLCNPSYLARPSDKGLLAGRLAEMLQGFTREEDLFRRLRLFRKQELLRIGLRDLLGRADLTETVAELSNLAEVCLQAVYEREDAELRSRFGAPLIHSEDGSTRTAGFAVIGMGKLGGKELNFSSDIDLVYVYTADGETGGVPGPDGAPTNRISNHQYFVKLAEKLSAAIGQNTADGFVFRVDLRLRPEGQRGPLAQSLGGYEIYYESWGQTWERSALIKARPVAGDEAVGREFLERITPFVYRKYLDFGAIIEIREMKQRINRDVEQKGKTHRDVKLGYGGIREIEFLVQSLQLIYGGRDRGLRERNTVIALHTLAQKGLLTYQEIAELSKAYAFLRTVEHRIQILNDLQTQTLPAGDAELRALARRTGYLEPGREAEALLSDYAAHAHRVRSIYDKLLSQPDQARYEERPQPEFAALLGPEISEQEAVEILGRYGFRDPSRAFRNIVLLREGQAFVHQTPRSRRVFNEMFPLLFEEFAASPDPDMALNYFESYLASQGSWDAFQAFMRQDVRALKVLVSVFGNSEYFSRMLVRSPALLEDLMDASREIGLGSSAFLVHGLDAAIDKAATITDKLDALRRFKHREELRIGMADLMGAIPVPAVCRSLTRLADACLGAALDLAVHETAKKCGVDGSCGGLAVIGAGKLGGRELIYGSDLDILFVYDEARASAPPPGMTVFEYFSKMAERTISYLTTMTREGFAYRVDTRLRPTGSKGPLVQSIEAVRSHFASSAETWECQSLVNARFVAGDSMIGRGFREALRGLIYKDGDPKTLAADVRSMRKRMQNERGKEDALQYNIKQGTGGLVDIEFLAQYLQLRHGKKHAWVRVPGTINALRALRKEGLLSLDDHRLLCDAYLFLRRLESRLRIVANQSTSFLSRDPDKLRVLAKRMGYADDDGSAGRTLLAEYERTRAKVRAMFERMLA